jgi:hypothetical protein
MMGKNPAPNSISRSIAGMERPLDLIVKRTNKEIGGPVILFFE